MNNNHQPTIRTHRHPFVVLAHRFEDGHIGAATFRTVSGCDVVVTLEPLGLHFEAADGGALTVTGEGVPIGDGMKQQCEYGHVVMGAGMARSLAPAALEDLGLVPKGSVEAAFKLAKMGVL